MFTRMLSVVVRWQGAFIALLLSGILFVGGSGTAHGQGKNSGVFLSEAFMRVTDNAAAVNRLGGYGYADGLSILAGWCNTGNNLEFSLGHLTQNTKYLVLAGGDKDAQQVNLEIFDPNGNPIASDRRVQPDALVEFTPNAKGFHKLRLSLVKARGNVPCVCGVTILKKGGWNVPLTHLDFPVKQLTATLAEADKIIQKQSGKRLDLFKADNQWALFGGIAKQGESIVIANITLGKGFRAFVAVGDKNADDVDLFLTDAAGKTIKEDTRVDPVAHFTVETGPGAHGLRVLNYKSKAPAIIMMSVFELR